MKNQQHLNEYFGHEWKSDIEKYVYTGPGLANKIAPDEWVLDVGCGYNYFKGKIKHLVGIDPANDHADVKVSIEDYNTEQKFDVAFCLGSINFGNVIDITKQIIKLESMMKLNSRIYWRCNPGLQDHKTEGCKQITFYKWTENEQLRFANEMGYKVAFMDWDNGNRLYAEWVR
jgi:hypothetical protein